MSRYRLIYLGYYQHGHSTVIHLSYCSIFLEVRGPDICWGPYDNLGINAPLVMSIKVKKIKASKNTVWGLATLMRLTVNLPPDPPVIPWFWSRAAHWCTAQIHLISTTTQGLIAGEKFSSLDCGPKSCPQGASVWVCVQGSSGEGNLQRVWRMKVCREESRAILPGRSYGAGIHEGQWHPVVQSFLICKSLQACNFRCAVSYPVLVGLGWVWWLDQSARAGIPRWSALSAPARHHHCQLVSR